MKTEYLNPFLVSVVNILESTINEKPVKGQVCLRREHSFKTENVVMIVGITGKLSGQVALSLTEDCAMKIAAVMLMEESLEELDDVAQSALAEMSNMITANAMIGLSEAGYQCDITPPSVVTGRLIEITCREGISTLIIPLVTSLGKIEVNLSLIETDKLGERKKAANFTVVKQN